jgi:SAM-dependent methyltransferase
VWSAGIEDLPEHEPFDSIVLLNVLEHIHDDRAALATLHNSLAIGGRLVLWVPAFEVLYGDFDHRIGHYRRYRINQLRHRCNDAGLRVIDARYVNAPGFFAWLLVVRLLGLQPTSGHLASLYDRWIVPATRRIEAVVRPPFGQSLLVVAQRVE